ncbi:helix-turn-helix domain-containing protein [Mycolicibacterium sp. 050232]|uniref:TetR/AcrR family transcriptional regulator n=1 Tax=Mycolicibacterium sp. 050232 TaxID=3113982 RepID=UPI002E2C2465|nr:helix-turn-helix domain-containing protein [Mycolicibacterium sp. 050232]MED5814880.1 helix-turn-helix domain-containing protein [Mycolicibacterium sp. 050232]
MTTAADRHLRADAARNVDRILRAARAVYSELGPDAHISAVAQRAGVGERTLYRHFPTKADLARAALDQCIGEDITPAIDRALRRRDPLVGLSELIDASISLAAREHSLLRVARQTGALTDEVPTRLYAALNELAEQAQQRGMLRPDLVADDLPRIIAMLHSVLWTMDPASGGWRRYFELILDAISTGSEKRTLPAAPAFRDMTDSENWPV